MGKKYRENVNRFNKVPAINHDGFKLSESNAIYHYLGRQGILPEEYYPKDIETRTKIDEFLSWEHLGGRFGAGYLFYVQWVQPLMTGQQPNPKLLEGLEKNLNSTLDIIENVWLKDTEYLTGNKVTVADLFLASDLQQARICNFDPTKNRPKIEKWLNKVKTDFDPHFENGHKYIYKYQAEYKGVPPIHKTFFIRKMLHVTSFFRNMKIRS